MDHAYLVWSNEHRAWWGPARRGYCRSLADAGRYTHAEALDICIRAMPSGVGDILPELPVRLADAMAMCAAFNANYPHVDLPF